jgi:hypothetical protein
MRELRFRPVLGTCMKRRFAVLTIVVASVVMPAYAGASSVTPLRVVGAEALAKSCGSGYVHANLSWGEKCLRAGQFCKVGNREYRQYRFACPSSGHLRRS